MFRLSTRNSPGSSVVCSSGSSSLSGLARASMSRRESPGGSWSASASAAETNGAESTSTYAGPGQAPADRAAQPLPDGQPVPGEGARHGATGMFS